MAQLRRDKRAEEPFCVKRGESLSRANHFRQRHFGGRSNESRYRGTVAICFEFYTLTLILHRWRDKADTLQSGHFELVPTVKAFPGRPRFVGNYATRARPPHDEPHGNLTSPALLGHMGLQYTISLPPPSSRFTTFNL